MSSSTAVRAGVSRARLAVAVLAAALLALVGAVPAAATTGARTVEEKVEVPAGAGLPGTITLDTTLYLPAATPAPAVLVAHGFGGTKASVDTDARALVDRGFVVLTWTARGFGASGGQIALDSPDFEVADARVLVDRLAARPEVVQDGPGDPRVGVTGGSYGGALALLLAGYDRRVDAVAPVITWNDLGQALFPNAAAPPGSLPADTPARASFSPDGVFKRGWAGVFFSAGLAPGGGPRGAVEGAEPAGGDAGTPASDAPAPTGDSAAADGAAAAPDPDRPLTCGRFTPAVCAAYTEAATTGRLSPATAELLRRSSPASVTDRITAPTLVVQGEADTLFGLDQADATARQIAAAGGTVRVLWYGGGHDGAGVDQRVRDAIGDWFDHWLAGKGDPGTSFGYTVASGVRTGGDTPTSRTVEAPAYPGLAGAPTVSTRPLPLEGEPQVALVPAGGNPAAITALPGLGGALGTVGSRIAAFTAELPGQSAVFRTAPVTAPLLVAGTPRVDLTVARVPGQPAPDEAVLFGKVYEVTSDGTRTLLGGAVAPVRVAVPADGSPARATVTLPAVVAPIEAGNRLMVSFGTTDQGYAGTTTPAAWRIGLGDGAGAALVVPVVPGEAVTANTVPLGPLLGIAGVLAAALLATVAARLWRRSRVRDRAAAPTGAAASTQEPGAPDTADVPRPGRWRSATSPRPTAAGSRPCAGCRSTSSGAWCWACSARTAPARPPCCAC